MKGWWYMTAKQTTRLRCRGPAPCSAFTLIEMVVVISIMALMVGIAIPVVGASLRITEVGETKDTMKALGEGIGTTRRSSDRLAKIL